MTKQTTTGRRLQGAFISAALLLTLGLTGCSTPKASSSTTELPFDQAAAQATDALVAQTRTMPAFLGSMETKRGILVDPMIDAGSGQRTQATNLLQTRVTERIGSQHKGVEILPFKNTNVAQAAYLLTGTTTRQVGVARSPLKINLALTDLRSGNVVAQSSAIARDDGIDNTPLPYDQDSPVLAKDQVLDGYVRTSATPPGQRADPYYMERVAVAPVIEDATALYNEGRYADALAQFNAAGAAAGGEQLRVLSGIYLASVKLDRPVEAQQAFRKIVDYGVSNKQLGVKFLFNPGSTVFWSDPKVSGPYAMWLGQIAQVSTEAKVCMDIVGHTSRTGSEPLNDALSLQRANFIRQKLATESAPLGDRTKASGKGFRENIIGSGTDNAVDALDRRVEFKIVTCS